MIIMIVKIIIIKVLINNNKSNYLNNIDLKELWFILLIYLLKEV